MRRSIPLLLASSHRVIWNAQVSSKPIAVRSATERFYHPELDVLRFFAFLLIFIHHSVPHDASFFTKMGVAPALASMVAGLAATGAFAVPLFLLLSSYLVTDLLIRERALRGEIDLRAFYIRRILRIWPLYFSFLALAWGMQWFVPGQHIGWRAGLAFAFFAGNWWIVFVGFPSSVIFPLWFISAQEQFYFFWPAVMRKLSERGMMVAAAVLLVIANVVRWHLALQHTWESKVWTNTFVQLDAVAFGIILAVVLGGGAPRLSRLLRSALSIGGFTCLVLAANYFRIKADPLTTSRVMLGYPVAAIGALALFLGTLRPGAKLLRNPLVYLGRISYGLYVFHILGLMISEYAVHDYASSVGRYLVREVVALATAIALAAISYRWLETPFLTLKQRFTHVLSRPGG
jgi:peptidoglycan/LPS O-acetylase OafA/YrhL